VWIELHFLSLGRKERDRKPVDAGDVWGSGRGEEKLSSMMFKSFFPKRNS
jgi:hypothetical protein